MAILCFSASVLQETHAVKQHIGVNEAHGDHGFRRGSAAGRRKSRRDVFCSRSMISSSCRFSLSTAVSSVASSVRMPRTIAESDVPALRSPHTRPVISLVVHGNCDVFHAHSEQHGREIVKLLKG